MPTVTKNLLIINCIVFFACKLLGDDVSSIIHYYGALHPFLSKDFNVLQLVTYQFLHADFVHLFFNMFMLWMFGRIMETVWGAKKILFYYLVCGVGAGLIHGLVGLFAVPSLTVGASGAVYGILLAFGMTFPNERMFIFPLPVPIKAKWIILGSAVVELYLGYNSSGDGVAHMAHLGGMLFGFFMIRYWNKQASFNRSGGQDFFDSLKRNFEQRMKKPEQKNPNMHAEQGGAKETDWEYNARKKANQEEIDRILDKIRVSGYDSLTKEEKKTLFDSSNKS